MSNYPRVCIIVLNWNGLEDTMECLESLREITYPDYEVVVVDNGSEGNDAEVLRGRFGDYAHVIANEWNLGYTGGNNTGIRYALDNSRPDYFLILNNDATVAPDFLTVLVEAVGADQATGIAGPKMYYSDYPGVIHSAGMKAHIWLGTFGSIGGKQLDTGQYDVLREVDSIAGCCILIKKNVVIRVGFLDESFFSYWDEVDYCFRTRKAGFRIIYVPKAVAWHKKVLKRRFGGKLPSEEQASPLAIYYWTRNAFKFMKKHATRAQYSTFLLYFVIWRFWFMTGVCLLHHRSPAQLAAFYRGVRDGLFNSGMGTKVYR